jgi:glutamate synthase (NADPH/NADH) small chain
MARQLTKKERLEIHRHPMPARDANIRIRDFEEVALGYTEPMAIGEAERCLACKKPKCVDGCPVGIDIPAFTAAVADGHFAEALSIIKADNTLPAICGRVCPQEDQCEATCVTGTKGRPVAIGRLERFVADRELEQATLTMPRRAEPSGFKVGVIGSGPAGLACAAALAQKGHKVTIFEALHKPGGVLIYGIPEFRLPKAVVGEEIRNLTALGVEIECNFVVGATATVAELMGPWGYDALFVGTGAGLPYFLEIPGENLIGVCSANEFLTRVNLMRAYDFPNCDTPVSIGRRVAVVGAGNVAMDCCRTALRLGCEDVICLYRRTRAEAPARIEELEHAEEEGIDFRWLTAPVRVLGNDEGLVTGVRVQRMALGEPDRSGRPRPLPVEGSEYDIEIDSLIIGIGQGANPLLTHATKELDVDRRGRIITEGLTQMTSIPGVFAGGDIVTGAATVILAMGAGKLAAASIDAWLRGVPLVADAGAGEGRREGSRVAVVADIAAHRMSDPAHA